MDKGTLEVECPVCDHLVPIDAVRCPNCNAVFSLSGVEELQKVARELNDPAAADAPLVEAPAPIAPEPEKAGQKEKSGLFGKLFKKKR
jgi:hypothetical protein